MYSIASAYPNSALSALSLMVIAFVVVGTLAVWLGLVFLADREPRRRAADFPASQRGAPPSGLRSEERSDERRGKTADSGAPEASGIAERGTSRAA